VNTTLLRADFPLLHRTVHHNKPLVYLDSAASSQKPRQVLDAMDAYYRTSHANVHRGMHALAEEATSAFESARARIAAFVGAGKNDHLIFTKEPPKPSTSWPTPIPRRL
jgi:cysteine desulfurase / selenocysteine lyase